MKQASPHAEGGAEQPPPALVILAAGAGRRYGGLKQIDAVGPHGETILDYSIYDALRAGFGKVVFVIRSQIEAAVRQAFSARYESRVEVRYVCQELEALPPGHEVPAGRRKPWGTGHAVLVARQSIAEPFAVVNADDFYGAGAYREMARWLRHGAAAERYAMVAYRLCDTLSAVGHVSRGICEIDEGGRLVRVVERIRIRRDGADARYEGPGGEWHPLSGDAPASMNFWGFHPAVFHHLDSAFEAFLAVRAGDEGAELYLTSVVDQLIRTGVVTVDVLHGPGPWFGLTHRDDKPGVVEGIRELIRRGEYPERLWRRP